VIVDGARRYQPVFIIGAARSGTRLLREHLAAHPEVDKVPYDINYIWRLGNEDLPHDELVPELLSPSVRERIVGQLARYSKSSPFLIEKTVSNTLRVPFVNTVFPKALFIHLIRDGYDVVESAFRQWTAAPNWRYVWRKARSFPLSVCYRYAFSYAKTAVRKAVSKDKGRVDTWGPRYRGIDRDLREKTVLEVCALQWSRCVRRSLCDLARLPADRVLTIWYEDFVQSPRVYLERIADFIGCRPVSYGDDVQEISCRNIGKGRANLTEKQLASISPLVEEVLTMLDCGGGVR